MIQNPGLTAAKESTAVRIRHRHMVSLPAMDRKTAAFQPAWDPRISNPEAARANATVIMF
jgi:hypothetical protein